MEPVLSFLKMGSSLVLVLGLMALTAYSAKRFLGSRLGLGRSASMIQVLATTYLDQKRQIAVIQVGGEYLVVGMTANQISLLTRLDNPPAVIGEDVRSRVLAR